jgi:[acyl-carrier-protein] S-malonyltransferase
MRGKSLTNQNQVQQTRTAFLFAGQGAQFTGMGEDIYRNYQTARDVFDHVSELADFDIRDFCFHAAPEQQKNTALVQPAIFTMSMATAAVLDENGNNPQAAAGLSLGEYAALCQARVFSITDGVSILRQRGQIMADALPEGVSGMYAVMMLDADRIQAACTQASLAVPGTAEIANYNCPGQIVISGNRETVDEAARLCLEAGAKRAVPLAVSGAFHTSLLKEAGEKLAAVLSAYTFSDPVIPVYRNLTGTPDCADTRDSLRQQISSSVRFEQTIRNMMDDGITRFIEIGPGKTLSGFVKKTVRAVSKEKETGDIQISSCQNAAELENLLK